MCACEITLFILKTIVHADAKDLNSTLNVVMFDLPLKIAHPPVS
jgi:hypothetical protein